MSKKLMEQPWLWNRFFDDAIENYIGAKNEPVIDYRNIDTPRLRIMDGQNAGGVQLGDYGDALAYVQTPQIISPLNNAIDVNPTPMFTASAFIGKGEGGASVTHTASYWEIARDAAFGEIIHSSGRVTDSLTVYDLAQVPLSFDPETRLHVRVRYESDAGIVSAWSPTLVVTTRAAWTTYFDTTAVIGGTTTSWMTSYSTTVAAVHASTSHVTSWSATYRNTSVVTSRTTNGTSSTSATTRWGTQVGSTSYVTSWSGSALTAKQTSHSTTKSRSTSGGSRTTSGTTSKTRTTSFLTGYSPTHWTRYVTSIYTNQAMTGHYTKLTALSESLKYTNYLTAKTMRTGRVTDHNTWNSGTYTNRTRTTSYSDSTSWTTNSFHATRYSGQTYYNTNAYTNKTQSKTTSKQTAINPGYNKVTSWATSFSGVTSYNTTFSTQVGGSGSRTTTYQTLMAAASSHITSHETTIDLDIRSTTYPTNYQTSWGADVRTTSHVTNFDAEVTSTSHVTVWSDYYRTTSVTTTVPGSFWDTVYYSYSPTYSAWSAWTASSRDADFFIIGIVMSNYDGTKNTDTLERRVIRTETIRPGDPGWYQQSGDTDGDMDIIRIHYEERTRTLSTFSRLTEHLTQGPSTSRTTSRSTLYSAGGSRTTTYSTQVSAGGSRSTSYQTVYSEAGSRSTSHDTTETVNAQTTTYETSRTTN